MQKIPFWFVFRHSYSYIYMYIHTSLEWGCVSMRTKESTGCGGGGSCADIQSHHSFPSQKREWKKKKKEYPLNLKRKKETITLPAYPINPKEEGKKNPLYRLLHISETSAAKNAPRPILPSSAVANSYFLMYMTCSLNASSTCPPAYASHFPGSPSPPLVYHLV